LAWLPIAAAIRGLAEGLWLSSRWVLPACGALRVFRLGFRQEVRSMDFKDRRIWYAIAAVIVVLIIVGYATGWFGGAPAPAPQQ
jgi:hypothetical protein